MILFLVAAVGMIFYFELLGQSVNSFLKTKNLPFNFVLGFLVVLASSYVFTGFLSGNNVKFLYIFIINIIILFSGLIIIVVQRKNLKVYFNLYEIILLIMMSFVSLYYSWNTSLGELHGFDTTHYLNMVSGSMFSKEGIYDFSVVFGDVNGLRAVRQQYSYQSYYPFCSTVLSILNFVCSLLNREFLYSSAYIWIFQIIFTFSINSIFVNSIRKCLNKKYISIALIFIMFVFFFDKQYFYSVFGFFGNSYRIVAASYILMFTLDLFETKDKKYEYLISICTLAGCAFTSSYIFIAVIYLFSFTIVYCHEDDGFFRWLALTAFLPVANFLIIRDVPVLKSLVLSFLVSFFLIVFNKYLVRLYSFKTVKAITVLIATLMMFKMSLNVTHNVFDFSAFLKNNSERADMTINYFSFKNDFYQKITILLGLFSYLLINRKSRLSELIWIPIICIFNPFVCSYLNSINGVYYRAYDAFINPYSLIVFYSFLESYLKKYKKASIVLILIIFMLVKNTKFISPSYYHSELFKIDNNYDKANKMTKTEYDVIIEMKKLIRINNLENPMICSPNLLTFSAVGQGRYIYGREFETYALSDYQKAVHKVFLPVDYYGQKLNVEYGGFDDSSVRYENAYYYLIKSGVDILVLSNKLDYHDEKSDVYYPIKNVVEWYGLYPSYENEDYSIYIIG